MKDHAVVVGSFNFDIFFTVGALPRVGESLDAQRTTLAPGGKGCNQAVQIAKLGTPTYMVGCAGSDAIGDYLLRCAQDYGLDTTYVRRDDTESGVGVNFTLPGGATCGCSCKGSNRCVSAADIDAAAPAFARAAVAVFQLEVPLAATRRAMELARREGAKVIFNPSPCEPCPDEVFALCDVVIFNEVEAEYFTGVPVTDIATASALAEDLTRRYGASIIITLGHQGSVVACGGPAVHIPPYPVEAVSATGAGDSFLGGVAHCLMTGDDLAAAARFAARCAAYTVRTVGCQNAMPTARDLESF